MPIWTLSFDIERSGARREYETIGIGASVVDDNFAELDRLFLPGFFPPSHPEKTVFETRCWYEFWAKNEDTLNKLIYRGNLTKSERQCEMIREFQMFRVKWEFLAKQQNIELVLVSDNCVYDGGFINDLIFTHLPTQLPIPYSALSQEYDIFLETHSQQKGLLALADPTFTGNWGLTKRIAELYEIPVAKNGHDHRPDNDAYTIAFDQQVLFAIRDGRIKRKDSIIPSDTYQ